MCAHWLQRAHILFLPDLIAAIEAEASKGTTAFYVGYHGDFDRMAATATKRY